MNWNLKKKKKLKEYWKENWCWRIENIQPLGQEPVTLGLKKMRKLKQRERALVLFLDINVRTIKPNVNLSILLHLSPSK